MRQPNCKGWLKSYGHPGDITITYTGSMSPPPSAVKLFCSRTGGMVVWITTTNLHSNTTANLSKQAAYDESAMNEEG